MTDWSQCVSPEGAATIQCFEVIFANIIKAVASLAGFVLLIFLIYGGFKYLTSGGDAKKVEQARGTLSAAIMGLVLIVGSYIILNLLSAFTGFQLTVFHIPTF